MTTTSRLRYQLHISDPIPFTSSETAPNGERQMFQHIARGPRGRVGLDVPWSDSSGLGRRDCASR